MVTVFMWLCTFFISVTGLTFDNNGSDVIAKTSYGNLRGMRKSTPNGYVFQFLGVPYAKPPAVRGLNFDNDGNDVIAKTSSGNLRGLRKSTPSGHVFQFLGVPYAKPPTGDRRFQKPYPPDRWAGIRDAFNFSSTCDFYDGKFFEASEDCLYLNVYVPDLGIPDMSSNKLSVMVWIHAGGYKYGSGNLYDGSKMAAKGIIVVNINHRLDIFGFLSTEDDVIPGNFGMMDQILALKWVQKNIHAFGGDPSKVTVSGESAGGSSVSLLLMSPLANGLFARAIMASGSSLSPWAITHPATRDRPRIVAHLVGAIVGCKEIQSINLLQCLRSVDYGTLLNSSILIQKIASSNNFVFKPRVENTFGFLPDLPVTLLAAGKFKPVNTLQGFMAGETGVVFGKLPYDSMTVDNYFEKTILGTLIPLLMGPIKSFAIPNENQFAEMALKVYNVTNSSDPIYIRDQTIQATSDLAFIGPMINEIGLLVSRKNVSVNPSHYLYRFSYRPDFANVSSWVPAGHAQLPPFVFGEGVGHIFYSKDFTESDHRIISQVMTSWSNFVKTGNPNLPDSPSSLGIWRPYTSSSDSLMNIDTVSTMVHYGETESTKLSLKLIQKIDTAMVDGDWIAD